MMMREFSRTLVQKFPVSKTCLLICTFGLEICIVDKILSDCFFPGARWRHFRGNRSVDWQLRGRSTLRIDWGKRDFPNVWNRGASRMLSSYNSTITFAKVFKRQNW